MALQWPRYVLQYMVICFYVRFQRIDIMKQKFEAENNSVLFKTILCPFKFSTTPSFWLGITYLSKATGWQPKAYVFTS